jgi:16S rRNA (guanine(966)-N(2))-methyltransferase RsmD
MKLRIIAGLYKGRYIATPSGQETRPTSERLREAVFNICAPRIENTHFLDLFAGSGAMGIEALSRGAKRATFVEHERSAITTIRKNLQTLEIKEETLVLESDVLKALNLYQGPPFDIIYIDPPYAKAPHLVKEIFQVLDQRPSLYEKGAWVFVEEALHSPSPLKTLPLNLFTLEKSRKVGSTQLLHFLLNS